MPKEPEKPKNKNSGINSETLREMQSLIPKGMVQTFVQKIEAERSAAKPSQTKATPEKR